MPPPEGTRFRLEVFYNWPGLLGLALIAVNVAAAVVVLVADLLVGVEYVGVVYALLALATLLGLAIACFGGLLGARRRRRGVPSRVLEPWTLDLMRARDRRFALAGLVATVLLAGVFASATGQGMRYMESREFCVNACHAVMEPEGTAALYSPHSQLECTECHVGSGAVHFARAKLNGMRQLWGVATRSYPRPIPVPVAGMLPADQLCERCHARDHWVGYKEKQYTYFAGDEENTAHPLRLLVKVGGMLPGSRRGEGIHYHMLLDRKVEFVTTDPQKSEILWVRVTEADGEVHTYRREEGGSEEDIAGKPIHVMSCLDCHSRPAHRFRAPTDLMNELLASGRVDPGLPSIKTQGVALLEQSYPDRATALASVDQQLRERYESDGRPPGDASVAAAISAIQDAWQRNAFPRMKVDWRTYPNHIGHRDSAGCFRCHNDELMTETGETVFTDCRGCHLVLTQGDGFEAAPVDFEQGVPFFHFADEESFEQYEDCSSCHNGGSDIY
jgi:nitrate/TMAO reductase-like tetraheme cytochrome c subunit